MLWLILTMLVITFRFNDALTQRTAYWEDRKHHHKTGIVKRLSNFKVLITTATVDCLLLYFSEKIRLDISCELTVIHIKYQVLLSLKIDKTTQLIYFYQNNIKKNRMTSATSLLS